MSVHETEDAVDLSSLQAHLAIALDNVENEDANYHLREAYQKVVFLKEE